MLNQGEGDMGVIYRPRSDEISVGKPRLSLALGPKLKLGKADGNHESCPYAKEIFCKCKQYALPITQAYEKVSKYRRFEASTIDKTDVVSSSSIACFWTRLICGADGHRLESFTRPLVCNMTSA